MIDLIFFISGVYFYLKVVKYLFEIKTRQNEIFEARNRINNLVCHNENIIKEISISENERDEYEKKIKYLQKQLKAKKEYFKNK